MDVHSCSQGMRIGFGVATGEVSTFEQIDFGGAHQLVAVRSRGVRVPP
jgi:hypothetical protein